MVVKAPAKINIGLNILSKRSDGYHNLRTLFYPIKDLYDQLIFEPSNYFEFICNDKSVPNDDSNLIVQAKNILEAHVGEKIKVKIILDKKIPAQAGLGGGSSDAASTLVTLNKINSLGLNKKELNSLALKLGSDVPFFISCKSAIGSSRGEILEYIDLKISEPILIIYPSINISTKEAFQNIVPKEIIFDYNRLIKDCKLKYSLAKELIINDFEGFVFARYPLAGEIKNKLYELGAAFSLLSGSGSSVYGIFPTVESARKAQKFYADKYFCFLSIEH